MQRNRPFVALSYQREGNITLDHNLTENQTGTHDELTLLDVIVISHFSR